MTCICTTLYLISFFVSVLHHTENQGGKWTLITLHWRAVLVTLPAKIFHFGFFLVLVFCVGMVWFNLRYIFDSHAFAKVSLCNGDGVGL